VTGTLVIDVARRFPGGPEVRARLAVPLEGGAVTVLFGPSGSGKTTVLRCVAGLDRPQEGSVRFRGETWDDVASRAHLPPQRRGVGLLFQDHALFPHLTVAGNVGYGVRSPSRSEREERIREAARFVRVDDLLARRPGALSGGQRQRVALARALAPRPRLLLLDEPLSALDAPTREELRGELRALLRASGIPSLVVTHDRLEALALGDSLAVLTEGGVRQVGPVAEVFAAPADLAVARVVGTENVLPARIVGHEEGLAIARVGPARIVAVDPGHLEGEAFACFRAEEVVLEPAGAPPTSARNHLAATVTAVAAEGPLVRVTLDAGFRLVALVTRHSAEGLALAPGRAVAALVKAPAVRLVGRGPAAPLKDPR
jgi:molybdate transport system ATP-binding protein